ncbi:MAG: phytanoyl-CoA dioxygenase [Saprospiraceae bacterium]|nr:phytanoyl-CoA dioxygenase [Saprospiraceae bacterium]
MEYLVDLGVDSSLLSSVEKDFLDANGYLILGKIMQPADLAAVCLKIEELMRIEGQQAGSELLDSPYIRHPKEAGADRLADLVNKGAIFDLFYTNARVLSAVSHVLGKDIKLSSLNYRAALPGKGEQNLHVDWHETVDPGDYKVCNTIWLLDDFTTTNGATRMVPGTHKGGRLPQEVLKDPAAPHPKQRLLQAPAGTVAVFNSHIWHGGTRNLTDRPRRSIHSYFCRRDQPQQVDQLRYIRQETRDRLSAAAQYLLAV